MKIGNKMADAIKCNLCNKLQECKRYDTVEFGTWETATSDDWNAVEEWKICKECKKKIRKFILNLKVKTQPQKERKR